MNKSSRINISSVINIPRLLLLFVYFKVFGHNYPVLMSKLSVIILLACTRGKVIGCVIVVIVIVVVVVHK